MLLLFPTGNLKTSASRVFSKALFIHHIFYILFQLSSCYMSAPHSNDDFIFGVIKKMAGGKIKNSCFSDLKGLFNLELTITQLW